MNNKCEIVAEIGCNHMGDLSLAKRMIRTAVTECGIRFIKFQKRNVSTLLSRAQFAAPHPNPANAFGSTYGMHREFLEFTAEQHVLLKSACLELGATYTSSVWDIESFEAVVPLLDAHLKIPSACNSNVPLLEHICDHFSGQIHVSLGMTTRQEETQLLKVFSKHRRAKDLVLYACTSGYPTRPEDTCLLEISRLRKAYGTTVGGIGYSGHHLETAIDIAAVALGAEFIERHFTLDRTYKGTDHQISLLPAEFLALKRDIETVARGMRLKSDDILPSEVEHRKKLKWQATTQAPVKARQ